MENSTETKEPSIKEDINTMLIQILIGLIVIIIVVVILLIIAVGFWIILALLTSLLVSIFTAQGFINIAGLLVIFTVIIYFSYETGKRFWPSSDKV